MIYVVTLGDKVYEVDVDVCDAAIVSEKDAPKNCSGGSCTGSRPRPGSGGCCSDGGRRDRQLPAARFRAEHCRKRRTGCQVRAGAAGARSYEDGKRDSRAQGLHSKAGPREHGRSRGQRRAAGRNRLSAARGRDHGGDYAPPRYARQE